VYLLKAIHGRFDSLPMKNQLLKIFGLSIVSQPQQQNGGNCHSDNKTNSNFNSNPDIMHGF